MFNIVLICGDNYSADVDGWYRERNYYGSWKYSLENHPEVNLIHWYPWCNWRTMPTENIDLYFFLDFRPDLWALADYEKLHPRVLCWGDAFHTLFSVVAQIPLVFDKVYVSEFLDAQHLKLCGFNNVDWLPGAFCPDWFKPLDHLQKEIDVGFIGQLDDTVVRNKTTRKRMFNALAKKFNTVVNQNIRGPAVNEMFNKSKILIERTIFCNMGSRIFETIGSGGFGLINKYPCYNGLEQLGMDGVHFVTYDESEKDAENKIQYYLTHEDERNRIAKAGYEYFLNHHTYKHRIDKILNDFR
jgi:hypothetical protein